ncbi:hypothetical protein BDEG_27718 [Batrachochytrium dendrobatidis JEL423]|uniref:Zf-CHY-domain-containing protein n=2 Tax=Batrachochytrium dendrobatidis TaxID=109871 RepID=A0A177WX50_BATDL|nr:hypothetical protein BDEG_27718 [Batrachochytrium dendrobatidis JEL423]
MPLGHPPFPMSSSYFISDSSSLHQSDLVMTTSHADAFDSDESMGSDSDSYISDSDYFNDEVTTSDMDANDMMLDVHDDHHIRNHSSHHHNHTHHGLGHGHTSLDRQTATPSIIRQISQTDGSSGTASASQAVLASGSSDNKLGDNQAELLAQKSIPDLMSSGWTKKQRLQANNVSPNSNKLENKLDNFDTLTELDKTPTWHDQKANILGCKHYQRATKLQAHCCGRWFSCRFCHDEVSDHNIIRTFTTTMMCMYCNTVQPAGQTCINATCGKKVALYYCHECKLWDNDPKKSIYHCKDCGICRIGKGLGQDYFHCKKCNVCMAISLIGRHKCIERNLESDCPICGEYMFTSTTTVIFMPCGHCIHFKCHQEYIQTSYQCPTCFKSLANMSEYFKRVDAMLAQHEMPPEYANIQSHVYCNDCEKKSNAKFHFLYHKCMSCNGYNTKVLHTFEIKLNGDKSLVASSPALLNATLPSESSHALMDASGSGHSDEVLFTGTDSSGAPVSRSIRARSLSSSAHTLGSRMRRTSTSGSLSTTNASGCN